MEFFDLHCDTLYAAVTKQTPLYQNNLAVSVRGGCATNRGCSALLFGFPIRCAEKRLRAFLTKPATIYMSRPASILGNW